MPPLVPCSQCHNTVAVEAEVCPHCGNGLPRKAFNAGTPYVVCGSCLATNHFFEGSGQGHACRSCGASLEDAYREKERELRIWREMWGLGLLGFCFGALVGWAMGGSGAWLSGGVLAALAGTWIGRIRYLVLVNLR